MHNSKKENLTIFLILSVLSAVTLYEAWHIPAGGTLGHGADFMPKIVGFLLLACALGFLIQGVRAPAEAKGEKKPWSWTPLIRFGAALGLLVLYVALLKSVGFIIMTALYIFAQSQLMVPPEKRSFLISGILAVVTSLLIYFAFTKGLSIILPAGILDGVL